MAETTTQTTVVVVTPDFADAGTVTVVPDGTPYQCAGPGAQLEVATEHVHDLLAAGWAMPEGQEPPPLPEVTPASGSVPGPDDPPPANPALEHPDASIG